jgi:hypothetical protein
LYWCKFMKTYFQGKTWVVQLLVERGGDNLDMEGHSKMEGSRCNVIIMKKHASVQFEILSTTSFHLYFVMAFNFLQMDQEWMYISNWVSQRFIERLETFLETVVDYKKPKNMSGVHYICCPCVDVVMRKKLEI